MSGYHVDEWHDLAVATAGGAAALTGLLFVAVSINLKRILEFPRLPPRAAGTLGLLLGLLLVSIFVLAPGQRPGVLGAELAAVGLALALGAGLAGLHSGRAPGDALKSTLLPLAILLVPAVALVVAGISLAAGRGGGLYWLLAAVVCGFVGAVANAWVFLVEIER